MKRGLFAALNVDIVGGEAVGGGGGRGQSKIARQ